MGDYFAMGGYAAYIWPAYGITFAMLAVLLFQGIRRYRRNRDELARLQENRPERDRS